MDGQSLCYKKLRKVYHSLEEQRKRATESHSNSLTYMNSLSNLLEQLSACDKVSFSKEPLVQFENLEVKLRFKITKATESVMLKLHSEMSVLKDVCKKISEYRKSTFEIYSHHAVTGNLSLDDTVQGSPTSSSIVELLEWLTDLDRAYWELYEQKLEILEGINYEEPLSSHAVLRSWKSASPRKNLEKFTSQVKIFLNEAQ